MLARHKIYICSTVTSIALIGGARTTIAQQHADGATVLNPIVITATSSERNLKDAPASISVISGEELRERPVSDLANALEGTPGIAITGVGLGRRGISVRGMQPDHTLILVDGMRVSNSSSAVAHSDFELDWVPSEAIERVEVVRGPMSSLYGSEALGGVVNVITRRATDHWKSSFSTNGLFTEHGLGGHQYNFSGYTGGPLIPGVLGLNVWGAFKGRTELSSPDNKQVTSLGDYKAFTGNATLTWTPDERQRIDLGYTGGYENRWSNMQGSGTFPKAYRSKDDIWRQRISLSHEGNWDWGTSRVRVYSALLNRENERSDNAPVSGPHKFIDTVGDGQISFSPLDNHKITLGGELRQERLKDPTVNHSGRASQMHYAGFFQDEIAIGENWEVVLGSRFDHHEEFGWEASPRAYVLYHFNEALTFKGGIGKGFKAPTLKQLSPEYEAIAGGGRFTIVGNPDLEPETNLSYEAGLEYSHGIWKARAMAFQNNVKNLIQTVCVRNCGSARGSTSTYENVDEARIRGIELGAGVELPWDMKFDVNYTYLDAVDETTGDELTGRSRHMANATLSWKPVENLTTQLRANYVGAQKVSTGAGRAAGYTLLSAYANYDFNEYTTLQLGVENITDKRLADEASEYSFADEGRRYFVGMKASF
ncbi:TonB-dependent receptor domain-containing protein [Brucella pseudogrignonensis]|uniref:TonB-dependent receptor domain-containing protein n=1 Tax=Brucella pseudogrignonensis TaxID=419475 RepID=UPI00124CFEE4|nr:TonB-dependent receptor [Brucella pseudogrignonensis]KAB2684316.1 TonB-dependent receptor [Brucella pseudogrignonensis]